MLVYIIYILPVRRGFFGRMAFKYFCPIIIYIFIKYLFQTSFISYNIKLMKIWTFNFKIHLIYFLIRFHGDDDDLKDLKIGFNSDWWSHLKRWTLNLLLLEGIKIRVRGWKTLHKRDLLQFLSIRCLPKLIR